MSSTNKISRYLFLSVSILLWVITLSAPFQDYDMNYLMVFLSIAISVLAEIIIILLWAKRSKEKKFWFEAFIFIVLSNPVSLLIGLYLLMSGLNMEWQN